MNEGTGGDFEHSSCSSQMQSICLVSSSHFGISLVEHIALHIDLICDLIRCDDDVVVMIITFTSLVIRRFPPGFILQG